MSIALAVATAWTLLVWVNWMSWNWLPLGELRNAVAPWGTLGFDQSIAAVAGHLRLAGWCAVFWMAAGGLGRPAVRWLSAARGTILATALGACLLGLLGLGVGLAGCAFPVVVRVVAIVAALCSAQRLTLPRIRWLFTGTAMPFTLLLGAGAVLPLLGALAPEASFDGMAHHLAHPELYAVRHKVVALPSHFLATYPALLEMQYLVARLMSGTPRLARLIHWSWGVLTLGVLVGWARETLEDSWALAAAAAFLFVPYVQLVMMWGYVDLGAACLLTLALRQVLARRMRPALLGVLCGLIAGVKVTGVFAAALVAAVLLVRGLGGAGWVRFVGSLSLVAAPWGAKNFLFAGNPAAPFCSGLMPTVWWGPLNHARYQRELASYDVGTATLRGWAGLLARPWDASIRNTGVLDTRAGMDAWFLWGLPLLLVVRGAGAQGPALFAVGWYALWHLIPHQVRYLLPVWPAAALAAAGVGRGLARSSGFGRGLAWALAGILAWHLPNALRLQREAGDPIRVVFGAEPAASYLARGMPGHEPGLRTRDWLNRQSGHDRVLVANQYGLNLFWGAASIVQSFFDTPLLERFARESRDAAGIARRFKQAGIGWVVCETENNMLMQASYHMYDLDPAAAARWRDYWSRAARLAFSADGRFVVYRLIPPARPVPVAIYPGLDEQALAALDDAEGVAEARGQTAADLKAADARYLEVAERTDLPAAWERVGLLRVRADRRREAREALRRAAALGRTTAAVRNGLGILDARDGRIGPAMAAFREALALDAGYSNARCNLALCFKALGRPAEGLAVLEEGLRRDPGAPDLRQAWGVLAGRNP